MVRGQHHHAVAQDAEGDRGQAGQDVADETHRVTDLVAAVFGEEDPDQGADGNRQQRSDADDLERPDDGVEHAATGHALWVR